MDLRGKIEDMPGCPAPGIRQLPTEDYFWIIRQQLAAVGRATIRVTGVSMKPFLTPIRDTVTIIPPDDTMRPGDIALYDTRQGRYILHRVTRIGTADFDMRGDNTIRGEQRLPKANLVGVVTSVTRNGQEIGRGSFRFHVWAAVSPVHRTWVTLWRRYLRPPAARAYHLIIPRRNGGQRNAEDQ